MSTPITSLGIVFALAGCIGTGQTARTDSGDDMNELAPTGVAASKVLPPIDMVVHENVAVATFGLG